MKQPYAPRIAVLASGSGTNFQAILDDGIEVALLVCDRDGIGAIEKAKTANVKYVVIDRTGFTKDREGFTNRVLKALQQEEIDLVVMAGFMTILSSEFFRSYQNRVLNIHPSLLPAFTGTWGRGTMTATLKAGVKLTGVTVHIATEEVDAGPILAQESVEVFDNDDEDTLHERIQKVEHRLYPKAIREFCAEHFAQSDER